MAPRPPRRRRARTPGSRVARGAPTAPRVGTDPEAPATALRSRHRRHRKPRPRSGPTTLRPPPTWPRMRAWPRWTPSGSPSRGTATAATGDVADGRARLGHDGPRHLALHDLAARPVLGRHRRRPDRSPD